MKRFFVIALLSVPVVVTCFGCGRTDLELPGSTGRDGGGGGVDGAARDGGADATAGRGAGGVVGSGGRQGATGGMFGTGGRSGSGGRALTGGVSGTGGRTSAGGASMTGGRPGPGGVSGTGGRPGTGGVFGTGGRPGTGGVLGSGGRSGTGGRPGTGGTGGAVDGGVPDGGLDRPPVDAGLDLPPSTPGALQCGAELCDTSTQSCCVSVAVGAVGARCVPIGMTCAGAALDCDEPADCAAGVCCFGLQAGGAGGIALGSRCVARATCNGVGRFVVCRTNADCRGAMPICCNSLGVPICQATCPGG